jgi:hypothetical protein
MDADWEAFVTRCSDTVRKIHETNDEGVYAKLYAADVSRLLAIITAMNDEELSARSAFGWTK